MLIIGADKDIRGELRTNGNTRKLAKGAYCAKPGGCKCQTQTNLQLPQVGAASFIGFSDPFKKRVVKLEGVQAQGLLQEAQAGPGRGSRPGDLHDHRPRRARSPARTASPARCPRRGS